MNILLQLLSPLRHGWSWLMLLLLFCLPLQVQAAEEGPSDDQINAVFLYNFAVFVHWPDTAFANSQSPFRYCVVGEDDFIDTLALTLQGEAVKGRSLVASVINPANSKVKNQTPLSDCQVVYIRQDAMDKWPDIAREIATKPILTVSDSRDFVASKAGMLSLVKQKNRIRPAINITNVASTSLKVSAKLRRISEQVSKRQGGL
ncbi:MAG: hypothetical protein ACI8WB_004598 [Phenylobacterium sp.]|jgi:hypothetical protein